MKLRNYNENDLMEMKERFFASYKAFVDCLMLTHNEYSMYSILVLKKKVVDGVSKVSIIIRNSHNNMELLNEYSNNVMLSDEIATELIDDIRKDFRDNHVISYSVVNPKDYTQTLQNTSFSLNIILNSEQELDEAINFNSKINSNSGRYRVLTKN